MSKPEIPKRDAAFAAFFSAVSRGLKYAPPLNNLIVGNNNVPHGWQRTRQPAAAMEPWIEFKGDSNGPILPIPRLYQMAGIVAVERSEMEELSAKHPGSHQAVAIRFGGAVVVGVLAEGASFAGDPDDHNRLLTGGRIGRAALAIRPGLWLPDVEYFVGAQTAMAQKRVELNQVPPGLRLS